MLPSTQLAMGIQSKSVRGLGAELSVRSKAPHEPWLSWGGAPLTQEIFGTFFFPNFFLLRNLMIFFSIFLEYFKTHFDLIERKIFTVSFMVILWSIFLEFAAQNRPFCKK